MSDLPYQTIDITDSLKLVQLQLDQASRLFELTDTNRQHLGEFLPWVPYVKTIEDSRKHIEETLENRAKGITYTYGIEFNGEIVGNISLRNINDESKTEIGYWIDQRHAGRGITTRAVKALTDFGINTLGLNIVRIRAVPLNLASNKVAEKAGYTFLGELADEEYTSLNVWVKRRT